MDEKVKEHIDVVMLKDFETYRIKETNLIGQIGEVIATQIN